MRGGGFEIAVYVHRGTHGVLVTDDEDNFTPWTPQGAARLRAAAAELAAAVVAHADAVATVTSRTRIQRVFLAGEELLASALACADAQADYSGNGLPFGVLHQFAEDDEDDDDGGDEVPAAGVTVL